MKPTSDGGQTLSEWKCSFDGDTARGAAETAVILDNRIVELERKVRVLGYAVQGPASDEYTQRSDTQYLVLVGTTADDVPIRLCNTMGDAQHWATHPDLWRTAQDVLKSVFDRDVPDIINVSIVTIRNGGPIKAQHVRDCEEQPDCPTPPAEQPGPTDDEFACGTLFERVDELLEELRKSNQGNERLSSRVKELEEENASLMAKAEAMTIELQSHRARRTGDDALLAEVEELKIKQYDLRDALRGVLSQIEDIRREVLQALDV